MKILLNIYMLMFFSLTVYAQKKIKQDTTIYSAVEINPQFPGGETAFSKFLLNHIHYPEKDKENVVDSRCFLQFIVEKNGTLANFKLLKGSKAMFNQIVDHLKKGPKWTPGRLNGKIVRVKYVVPVTICLSE